MTVAPWVFADVVDGFQTLLAGLELIASSNTLDASSISGFSMQVATGPAPSGSTPAPTVAVPGLFNCMSALYAQIPTLISSDFGVDPSVSAGLNAIAAGLVAAMNADAAVAAFAEAADSMPDAPGAASTATSNRIADAANLELIARFSRIVYVTAYAQALVKAPFSNRAAAIQARADCADRFERELSLISGGDEVAVADALTALRDAAAAYLTQAIINAQPILDIEAPPLPALFWAWNLYQDPTRASELIALNVVPTAEFMPPRFEAKAA